MFANYEICYIIKSNELEMFVYLPSAAKLMLPPKVLILAHFQATLDFSRGDNA